MEKRYVESPKINAKINTALKSLNRLIGQTEKEEIKKTIYETMISKDIPADIAIREFLVKDYNQRRRESYRKASLEYNSKL